MGWKVGRGSGQVLVVVGTNLSKTPQLTFSRSLVFEFPGVENLSQGFVRQIFVSFRIFRGSSECFPKEVRAVSFN